MPKKILTLMLGALALVGVTLGQSAQAAGDGFSHHLAIHVDENDAAKMNLALNNAANVVKYYEGKGQRVQVEIITYGPGLNMLRADKSPVKDRLDSYVLEFPDVTFAACNNTMKAMTRKEGKAPQLISSDSISVVPSGVVQIMMRQDQGWHYLRP